MEHKLYYNDSNDGLSVKIDDKETSRMTKEEINTLLRPLAKKYAGEIMTHKELPDLLTYLIITDGKDCSTDKIDEYRMYLKLGGKTHNLHCVGNIFKWKTSIDRKNVEDFSKEEIEATLIPIVVECLSKTKQTQTLEMCMVDLLKKDAKIENGTERSLVFDY